MSRLLRVLLLAAALTVGALTVGAPAATAAPTLAASVCDDTPTPTSPRNGIGGLVLGSPKVLPPNEDPFKPGARSTIYEQYGLAGLGWETYDKGCVEGIGESINKINATVANLLAMPSQFLVGVTTAILNAAFNPGTWTVVLDAPMQTIANSLRTSLTTPFGPLLALIGAVALAWLAKRMLMSAMLSFIFIAVCGVAIVAMSTGGWMNRLTNTYDNGLRSGVVGAMSAAQGTSIEGASPWVEDRPGTRMMSALYVASAYDRWVAGTLGSASSPTAKKYGPRLFKAHALTWREAAVVESDPDGRGKDIIEAKKNDWEAAAEDVKNADPAAYEYLKGAVNGAAAVEAVNGGIAAVFTAPFPAVSGVMVTLCFLLIRLLLMASPVIGILLFVPRFTGLLRSIGNVVAASLLNSIIFAIGGGTSIALTGALLRDDRINDFFALILVILFSIVMWIMLKPFRRITAMVSDPLGGVHKIGSAGERFKDRVGSMASTALGAAAGIRLSGVDDDDDDGSSTNASGPPGVPTVRHSDNIPDYLTDDRDDDTYDPGATPDTHMLPAAQHTPPPPPRDAGEYRVVPDPAAADTDVPRATPALPTDPHVWFTEQSLPPGATVGEDRMLPTATADPTPAPITDDEWLLPSGPSVTPDPVTGDEPVHAGPDATPDPLGDDYYTSADLDDGVARVTPLAAGEGGAGYARSEVTDGEHRWVVYDPQTGGFTAETSATAAHDAGAEAGL